MTVRLLPKNQDYGWTPYVWLVYLLFFFIDPVIYHWGLDGWIKVSAAVGVFLVLYFTGYWRDGWRLVLNIAGLAALGLAFLPETAGAGVFFIYAAAFIPFTSDAFSFTVRILVGLEAALLLEVWLMHIPAYVWVWVFGFVLVLFAVNTHYCQRRRADAKLRMAQEEIEHLAKVAERERIARDLHDVLGHTLTMIVLKSELASKLMSQDAAAARAEIQAVERISRQALADVREAIRGYRAESLESEFRRACATLETAGVRVDCQPQPAGLTPAQEGVLALVLREAVTNIIRHAQARNCRLELQRVNGDFRMAIADDGCGASEPEGNGLRGMRERVEALGGTLQRANSNGTSLTVLLPAQDHDPKDVAQPQNESRKDPVVTAEPA